MFKRRIMVILFSIFILSLSTPIFAVMFAQSLEPTFSNIEVSEVYYKDSVFNIPQVTSQLNGINYNTNHKLVFPSGRESLHSKNTLNEAGKYNLEYSFSDGSQTYYKAYNFETVITYANLWTNVRHSEIKNNVNSPAYIPTPYNGVKVTGLRENATVQYNSIIDLSNNTKNDLLLQLQMTPAEAGIYEFSELYITFTDVYDSQNFVTVLVSRTYIGASGAPARISRVKAGANLGYLYKSIQYANGGPVNGGTIQERAGFELRSSFMGVFEDFSVGPFELYFDYAERAIYMWPQMQIPTGAPRLVLDLDNPDHVGTGNEWQGFTTGEMQMSITQRQIAGTKADYMVLNVNGQSMSGEYFKDTEPPSIKIDFKGNDENNLPMGVKAVPYKLFDAMASDLVDGDIDFVGTDVFYTVNGVKINKIAVSGNSFIPAETGTYLIEYKVSDNSGNLAQRDITISVNENSSPIFHQLEYGIVDELFAGSKYKLPTVTANGGSGKLNIERIVKFNNVIVAVDLDTLYPQALGKYSILYEITDYIGQKAVFEYFIDVDVPAEPVMKEMNMPKGLLVGYSYTLPEFTAIDYYSGTALSTVVDIFLQKGAGEQIKLGANRKFNADTSGIYTVTYKASSISGQDSVRTYQIEVRDVTLGTGFITEYFLQNGFNISADANGIEFIAQDSQSNLSFINAIPAENFSIQFNISQNNSGMSAVVITLTDSLDISQTVDIRLIKKAEGMIGSFVQVNNAEYKDMLASFVYGSYPYPIMFQMRQSDGILRDYNDSIIDIIRTYANGSQFNGFSSGKVYINISFEYKDNFESSGIKILAICNQAINNMDEDYTPPIIVVNGNIIKSAALNSSIILPSAKAYDILNPITDVKLTITAPGGTTVVSNISINKNYTFTVNMFGLYTINYKAISSDGIVRNLYFSINVPDLIDPVLTINGSVPQTGKLNSTITLPSATVTDNHDIRPKVYVFYVNPTGMMQNAKNNQINLSQSGVYTVIYFAMDSNYNYIKQTHNIIVS